MSVRDKIASFGGASSSGGSSGGSIGFASTSRIGTTIPPSSSNARAFPHDTTPSGAAGAGDAVRKLNVPSVFKNATKPADAPAAGAAGQPSVSAAAKKWGAPATKAGAPSRPGASSGAVSGSGGSGSSAGSVVGSSAGSEPASRWAAPAHGSQNGAAPSTAKRAGADKGERKPRDLLGLGSGSSSSSSSSYRPPAATASKAGGESATRTGGDSGNLSSGSAGGRASPSSRSNKPKAGPRKLNLTRISAEKQRAALCLDKVVDEEADDNAGGPKRPGAGAASLTGAPKPAAVAGSVARTGSGGVSSSSSSYSSSSYTKPAASRATASGRAVGGTAARSSGSGGASKLPTASSLRSSGHNLW